MQNHICEQVYNGTKSVLKVRKDTEKLCGFHESFFLEEANIVSLSNILQITSYVTTLM